MSIDATTLIIRVSDALYPVTLEMVRQQNTDKSFKLNPTEDQLAQMGYAVVRPVAKPAGQIVIEQNPVLKKGYWEQTWFARDYSTLELVEHFETFKKERLAAIAKLQVDSLARGATYRFPDNTIGHVQLRDGDRANLSGLRLRALGAKQANKGEQYYFRVWEDMNKGPLSADEIIVMSDIAFEKYMLLLGICWTFKDQAKNAKTFAQLPQVPDNLDAYGI